MYCPTCGKELYDNGECRFNCPFCGAEVVGSGSETEEDREETLEERCKRLERELTRQKLKAEIEEQSAAEHFWFRGGNLFSMLDRQSARNALERGDIESAKKTFGQCGEVAQCWLPDYRAIEPRNWLGATAAYWVSMGL